MTQPVRRRFISLLIIAVGLLGGADRSAVAQDPPSAPTVAFAHAAAVVSEGAGRVTVPIRLSAPASEELAVTVTLRGGTATVGEDMTVDDEAALLTVPADGTAPSPFVITVHPDEAVEGFEYIDLVLRSEALAIDGPAVFRLWIRDEGLYPDRIAAALTEQLRADFTPPTVLTARSAADSLFGAVWNEAGGVRGVFGRGQVDLSDAGEPAMHAREQGLVAAPVGLEAAKDAAVQRDLHALMPMHEEMAAVQRRAAASITGEDEGAYPTPRPAVRGDVARALLYTHALYAQQGGIEALTPLLPTLADWMAEDPVDNRELDRMTRIARYQGHPNPFVLAPELADAAFNVRGTYPTPTVAFVQPGGSVSETDSVAVVEVVADGVGDRAVTLTVGLDGAASSVTADDLGGFRYRTLTFPAGAPDGTVRRVRVPVALDEADEDTERATLTLRNTSGFTRVGDIAQYTLDIENARQPASESEGRIVLGPAYPNPLSPGKGSTVRFEVGLQEALPLTVEVFSTLGQRVRMRQYSAGEAARMEAIEIDAQGLPSGLYILRLQAPAFTTTETFVVVR